MYTDNLKSAEENASYLVREKSGILYLDFQDGILTKLLQNNKIENTLQNRCELRSYLLKSKNIGLYFNAITLTQEAYSQKLNDYNGEDLIPNFLNRKGISHGLLFDSLDLNKNNGLNYNEYLKETFKYYADELKCSFIKVTGSFSAKNALIPIVENDQENIGCKINRMSNIARRAQEAGLAVIIHVNISEFQNIPLNLLFKNYENILAAITKIFIDNEVLSESIIYALPILGISHIGQRLKNKLITYEEIAALNFVTWTRSIIPAIKLIYPHTNEDNSGIRTFSDACSVLNEIIKMEIKKPWAITFAMGPLLYSNSIEYWGGDIKKVELASSLFLRRIEAVKASMNGDFKTIMAQEATFESNIKEVGDNINTNKSKVNIKENNAPKKTKIIEFID